MTREEFDNKCIQHKESFIHKLMYCYEYIDSLEQQLKEAQAPKTCYGCKWYRDFKAVCVNDDCPLCVDFVSPNFGCVHFEPKDKE